MAVRAGAQLQALDKQSRPAFNAIASERWYEQHADELARESMTNVEDGCVHGQHHMHAPNPD